MSGAKKVSKVDVLQDIFTSSSLTANDDLFRPSFAGTSLSSEKTIGSKKNPGFGETGEDFLFEADDDDYVTTKKKKEKKLPASKSPVTTDLYDDFDLFASVSQPSARGKASKSSSKLPSAPVSSSLFSDDLFAPSPSDNLKKVYPNKEIDSDLFESFDKQSISVTTSSVEEAQDHMDAVNEVSSSVTSPTQIISSPSKVAAPLDQTDESFLTLALPTELSPASAEVGKVSADPKSEPAKCTSGGFQLIDDNMFSMFDLAAQSAVQSGNAALADLDVNSIKTQVRSMLDEDANSPTSSNQIKDSREGNMFIDNQSEKPMFSTIFGDIGETTLEDDVMFSSSFSVKQKPKTNEILKPANFGASVESSSSGTLATPAPKVEPKSSTSTSALSLFDSDLDDDSTPTTSVKPGANTTAGTESKTLPTINTTPVEVQEDIEDVVLSSVVSKTISTNVKKSSLFDEENDDDSSCFFGSPDEEDNFDVLFAAKTTKSAPSSSAVETTLLFNDDITTESALYNRAGLASRAQILNFSSSDGVGTRAAMGEMNTGATTSVSVIDDATGKVTVLHGLILPSEAVSARGEDEKITVFTDNTLFEITADLALEEAEKTERALKAAKEQKEDATALNSTSSQVMITKPAKKPTSLFDDEDESVSEFMMFSKSANALLSAVDSGDDILSTVEKKKLSKTNSTNSDSVISSSLFESQDSDTVDGIDDNFDFNAYIKAQSSKSVGDSSTTKSSGLFFLDE